MKKWIASVLSNINRNQKIFGLLSLVFLASFTITSLCVQRYNKSVVSMAPVVIPPEVGPVVGSQEVYADENWELTLPGKGWNRILSNNSDMKLVLSYDQPKRLIMFIKENTADSFDDYVVSTVRGAIANGAAIVGIKKMKLNGTDYAVVLGGQENLWLFIAVKGGFGYTLFCGGPPATDGGSNDTLSDMCGNVSVSLKIK